MKYSVALCFDENYQVQTRTVMHSLIKYGLPKGRIEFYLITGDKDKITADAFFSLENERVSLTFLELSSEHRDYISGLYDSLNCSKKKYISKVAIAKCLLPLLVEGCDRLLYLDSDMIVVDDISELWKIDLSGKKVAAVPDLKLSKSKNNFFIRYSEKDRYFNSGLMLFNLKEIHKQTLLQELAAIYNDRKRKYQFMDQDQLNILFRDSVEYLPLMYNLFARFPCAGKEFSIDITKLFEYPGAIRQMGDDVSQDDVRAALEQPKIIHFVTRKKPWNSFDGYKYYLWRSETCEYNWSRYYLNKDIADNTLEIKETFRMKLGKIPGARKVKNFLRRALFRR